MPPATDLNTLVNQVQQLAPLPAVALRVMELAQDDHSNASDLASVIATDQAMTAKLLRLANSAYFAAGREIKTARDAVVMLGMMEVRRLVLTSALMGRFGDGNGTMSVTSFWGHGLAVGMVAEVTARHTKLAQPEEAFTAGVIHDIGKLVMDQYLKDRFAAATALATTKGMALVQAEREVFGYTHAQVGARLAEIWRLPASLSEAIAEHHNAPGQDSGLRFVVAQANDLCRDHGLWCGFEDTEPGATLPDTHVDDPMRAAVLSKLGGWERVIERSSAFVESSPALQRRSVATLTAPAPGTPASPGRMSESLAGTSPRRAPWVVADRFPNRFGQR
ncbi:MAG: HDOD domain-containing protein [Chloroflexi bacterium]|nr:HDOD domain-containing protein [Chloroflexota bacterium]